MYDAASRHHLSLSSLGVLVGINEGLGVNTNIPEIRERETRMLVRASLCGGPEPGLSRKWNTARKG